MLGSGTHDGASNGDTYKSAVIDTIVAEVQGNPGDDRCVLMLGYESLLREMFQVRNIPQVRYLTDIVFIECQSRTLKKICYRRCLPI